jgi:hypothetical protein
MLGHWTRKTARLHVPMVDDWLGCRELIAPGNFPAGSSFRNRLVDGLDRLCFPALPRCAGYCPCAATLCCPMQRWASAQNSALPREAGFAKARAVAATPSMCSVYSLAGHSSPAHCALEHSA